MTRYEPPQTGRSLLREVAHVIERRGRRSPPGATWGSDWYKSEGKPVVLELLALADRTAPTRSTLPGASAAALEVLPDRPAAPWPSLRELATGAALGPGYRGDWRALLDGIEDLVPPSSGLPAWVWVALAVAAAAALS